MLFKPFNSSFLFGCMAISPLLVAESALAQVIPPQLPSPEEVRPPVPEAAQPEAKVEVDSRGALARQPCPFDDSPLTLDLRELRFQAPDGGAVPPAIAAALQAVRPPTGTQSIRTICDLRDEANAALRAGGWVAQVQIPAQEITGGTLILNVITARIVETRVRGSVGPYEDILRSRIAQIQALDPLNEREAERLLLLASDIPGLEIRLSLTPAGTRPGEVIGDLNVSYRRFAVLGNIQNYNSANLGRETGYLRAEFYGLTGMGDVTYLGASSTFDFDEQKIVQAGHIVTLGSSGATLGGRFTYAWSRPDLGTLDYRTDTLIAGFDFIQPLARSVKSNASVSFGFDYVDQITDVYNAGTALPLTGDKLRVAYVGINGDTRARDLNGNTRWSLRGEVELRKGFDIFGSSDQGFSGGRLQSRIDGNSRAFVARGEVQGIANLGNFVSLNVLGMFQWTNDPLLNFEEFSIGSLTVGRGYDPGSNSGDRAAAMRAEVQFKIPTPETVAVQAFGFFDIVHLDNLDAGAIEVDRTLRSYGGGFRFSLPGSAQLEVIYAKPKDRALILDAAPPTDRVLVSLSFRLRDRLR